MKACPAGMRFPSASRRPDGPLHDRHRVRPATPADSEFCFQLHKAAMGGYITAIWGWDERRQRGFHARGFDPGRWQIITAGGADTGMLHVEYRPAEIYVSRIEIHPSRQGRGTGTRLISALIDEARRKGQDLVLDVLTVNTRAQALYQRLGMTGLPGTAPATSRSPCGPPGPAGKIVTPHDHGS